MLVGIYEKDCYIFHLKTYCSLLDNAPNYLVGCVIQKRMKLAVLRFLIQEFTLLTYRPQWQWFQAHLVHWRALLRAEHSGVFG